MICKVYRSTSLTGTKVFSSWFAGNSLLDTTAQPGVMYYYWVTAATSNNGAGESDFSLPDEGYVPALGAILTPAYIDASDGSRTGGISLRWPTVPGATHYKVYRSTNEDGTDMAYSGWFRGTYLFDGSAIAGQTYYYWVQASQSSSGARASGFSDHDTGYAAAPGATLTPVYIDASDGTYSGGVILRWPAVVGATHYKVFRSTSETGDKVSSSWFGGTALLDNTATPGQSYFYWVQAAQSSTGANASGFSGFNTGYYRSFAGSLYGKNSVAEIEDASSDDIISDWLSADAESSGDVATSFIDPYEPTDIDVQFDLTPYMSLYNTLVLSDIDGYALISSVSDDDYYKAFLLPGTYEVIIGCDRVDKLNAMSVILYNCYGKCMSFVTGEETNPILLEDDLYVPKAGYYYIGVHPLKGDDDSAEDYPVQYDLDINFLRW